MGPRGEANFVKDMPRKARRAALRSILSSKARNGLLSVISAINLEKPKTQLVVDLVGTILKNMEAPNDKILFVLPGRDENFERSVRNIPTVKALLCGNLNPHDLLYYDRLVLFEGAVPKITEVLA